MSFVFGNSSLVSHYRTQLYVNGWQFGKYANAIGPQTRFPVRECSEICQYGPLLIGFYSPRSPELQGHEHTRCVAVGT